MHQCRSSLWTAARYVKLLSWSEAWCYLLTEVSAHERPALGEWDQLEFGQWFTHLIPLSKKGILSLVCTLYLAYYVKHANFKYIHTCPISLISLCGLYSVINSNMLLIVTSIILHSVCGTRTSSWYTWRQHSCNHWINNWAEMGQCINSSSTECHWLHSRHTALWIWYNHTDVEEVKQSPHTNIMSSL